MEIELSDSVDGQLGSESVCSSKEEVQEHFNNFKNTSDIPECSSDDLTNISVESLRPKQSQKSVILAKKRLQAYTNKFKAQITKDDKDAENCIEHAVKQPTKKSKKVFSADDAAKAVIRDIEELKRTGFGCKQASFSPLSMEAATIVKIKPDTKVYFTAAKDDQLFKKREIKCRNIRKSEIEPHSLSPSLSVSHKINDEHECTKKEAKQYPKNWQEYIELNLTPEKDAYLKTKLFKKPRERNFNLKQYYNFETPSVPIEIYRCQSINGDPIWVPYSYLRATIVQPQILYSTNQKKTNSGYLQRDQLFALITKERKEQIEQLYKTSLKIQVNKHFSVRKWYPKNWKKFDHSEGKLLESSIGLSFLQTYSDEEDNVEDDVTGQTSTKDDGLYTPPLEANSGSSISATPEHREKITNNENKTNETIECVDINEWNISKITDIELSAPETESVEDEYDKTKKELEKLEAALKNNKKYVEEDDIEASHKKDKKNRPKKDTFSSSDEKNVKKKLKGRSIKSKKEKRKDNKLSDSISDSSDSEKVNKIKKRKRKLKKEIKRKEERKEKKHKGKTKKKKKVDDDVEDILKSNVSDDNSSNNKPDKEKQNIYIEDILNTPPEILPPNSQDNFEEDIMYFTNRFSQDRIPGKSKISNAETEISKNINKHKDFINLEELVCSNNDNVKIADEKSKSEYKVDLLKKNEEYLKNQERQRMEQKVNDIKDIVSVEDEETRALNASRTSNPVDVRIHENQPDWEEIKNKRKKHMFDKSREGDLPKSLSPVSSQIDDSTDIIVKQEIISNDLEIKKTIISKHFSSSWESDEEPLEISSRNDRIETKSRGSSFSLEIPLNIKHFTRREVKFDPDRFDLNLITVNDEDIDNRKMKRKNDDTTDNINDCNISKKKRWDIKLPDTVLNLSTVKVENVGDLFGFNEANVESQDKLEDEYEEFLKAVTSTKNSHQVEAKDMEPEENTISVKKVVTNLDELMPKYTEAKILLDNSNAQSVLVNEQSGLGPVPSPKIETVLDFNKPLINLSLSANVTQNITLSLATTATNISAPITSTIDISKTSLKITNEPPRMVDQEANVETFWSQTGDSTTEPTTGSLNNFQSVTSDIQNPSKQKILFTSLTLPSKKQLVNTSLLNLDESDNEDKSVLEERKRKKLEAHIEDNKREIAEEKEKICGKERETCKPSKSPDKNKTNNWEEKRDTSHRTKRESPKRRRSPTKRRESPVRRRSPARKRSPRRSPRRRLSPRRRSPSKRNISPSRRRKSISPRRRRTPSPRRRRTISPLKDKSPKRHSSPSSRPKRGTTPRRDRSHKKDLHQDYHSPNIKRSKSPSLQEVSSSLEIELKHIVADSTISDDQLPESTTNDDFNETVEEKINEFDSPRRLSLDDRINQVLGYDSVSQSSPKTITSTYNYNTPPPNYQYNDQYNVQSHIGSPALRLPLPQQNKRISQSCYKQVGNMLQIVPSEDIMDIPIPRYNHNQNLQECTNPVLNYQQPPPRVDVKPQILQVGNMLHIVPTEIVPTEMIPLNIQQEVKQEAEHVTIEAQLTSIEKPSAETALLQKVAERRAERDKRRQEKENRRKEKEQRRKEKQKARTDRSKVRTEHLIKIALELEQEEDTENLSEVFGEKQTQWPPPLINYAGPKEVGKGILLKSGSKKIEELIVSGRRVKTVKFADGIKPGEGTSPSAGEELSSPPPPKSKLPKEKRFKKTKFNKKTAKKKVKVKVIKKPVHPPEESDSEDNLPPPSPPPGSPPPHIFPPRIKVNSVNNVPAPYLTTLMQNPSPQQPQQQFQSSVYRSPIGLIMAPPPPPQGHAPGPSPVVQTLSSNRLVVSPVPAASHHASQTHYPPPSPSTPNSSHHHHHSLGPFGHSRHY